MAWSSDGTKQIGREPNEDVEGLPNLPNGTVIWLTGLSCAGKSTIAKRLCEALDGLGRWAVVLDADDLRLSLCKDLGFTKGDRDENVRRIGCVAELFARNGAIVIVAAISPYRMARDEVRRELGRGFVEVYVNASIGACESRDVKGLYRKSKSGELRGLAGVDDPYEPPLSPEIECLTDHEVVEESINKILWFFRFPGGDRAVPA